MIQLEKYHGAKSRHTCPACNSKHCFVRYQDENGEYLASDVGRCNRESKCGYHYKPKEYFAVNPSAHESRAFIGTRQKTGISNYTSVGKNGTRAKFEAETHAKKPDYVPNDVLLRTLANYSQNNFVCYLLKLFPNCGAEIEQVIKDYRIGTSREGKTIFWQIDQRRKVRTGKIIAYDGDTGKRRKDVFPNWTHAELKKRNLLKPDFNLKQCFFGTHLLRDTQKKNVCLVEAEKTAVIAALCFPEFVWLAVGAKQSLKPENLKFLRERKIILYPDADAFDLWTEKAQGAARSGLSVKVSSLIENHATATQKANGYDLADYLTEQQNRINEHNGFADGYNVKLEKVLSDEKLFENFETILDEQKAILIDRGMSDREAETFITNFENLREIILSV